MATHYLGTFTKILVLEIRPIQNETTCIYDWGAYCVYFEVVQKESEIFPFIIDKTAVKFVTKRQKAIILT